jgi:hypothetical protein
MNVAVEEAAAPAQSPQVTAELPQIGKDYFSSLFVVFGVDWISVLQPVHIAGDNSGSFDQSHAVKVIDEIINQGLFVPTPDRISAKAGIFYDQRSLIGGLMALLRFRGSWARVKSRPPPWK